MKRDHVLHGRTTSSRASSRIHQATARCPLSHDAAHLPPLHSFSSYSPSSDCLLTRFFPPQYLRLNSPPNSFAHRASGIAGATLAIRDTCEYYAILPSSPSSSPLSPHSPFLHVKLRTMTMAIRIPVHSTSHDCLACVAMRGRRNRQAGDEARPPCVHDHRLCCRGHARIWAAVGRTCLSRCPRLYARYGRWRYLFRGTDMIHAARRTPHARH
ncbi:hypothetical protein B0H13DRAFT_773082 [Mycena leptocephala]|nr:hypothetical protein B0H13DRAFT_773082 [Mycena leptocephala]